MDFVSFIGLLAGILTTLAFIPQVIKVVQTKSTNDISLAMFAIFILGVFCWIVYGVLLKTPPLIISNSLVLVMALIILGYKLRYK